MDDALLAGPIKQLDCIGVSSRSVCSRGGSDLLEGGPELTPVSAVLFGAGTSLTHALCSGPDTGHGNLGDRWIAPESLRSSGGKN
jgi:hypothetical protein